MRRSFLAALLLCVATVAAAQQKMERPGITNYTKVDAVVACGGATETAALEGLKKRRLQSRHQPAPGDGERRQHRRERRAGQGARPQLHPHSVQRPGAGDQDRRRLPGGRSGQGQPAGVTSTAGRPIASARCGWSSA